MRIIYPAVQDNPRGSNPENSVYIAINKLFPELGLTQANSKIIDTQPAATTDLPYLKRVLVLKGSNPNDTFEFFYSCYYLPQIFPRDVFATQEQLDHALSLKTSAELIEYIGLANNLNLRAEDFWVSDNSIEFTGGTKTPNWLMKAKYNAQWYLGETIISLWK